MRGPFEFLFRALARRDAFYVISHERSGTHFAINTIFRNVYVMPRLEYVPDWLGPYDQPATRNLHLEKFRGRWEEVRRAGGIVKSHCSADLFAAEYPDAPVVYVLRDARDTLVSLFHYLNSEELYRTNPGLADQRCRDFSEFLRRPASDYLRLGFFREPDFDNVAGRWASHVSGWLARPGATVVRYEDLKRDYRGCVRRVCRAVGLVPRLFQRPVRMGEGAAVLPRKGEVGGWPAYFSAEDEAFLAAELGRRGLTPEGRML